MSRKLPPLDFADLYRRYQAGQTGEQLAAMVGIGTTTLHRHFRTRGYILRNSGRPRKHPGLAAIRGKTAQQLAAQFGVNEATARDWLRAIGEQPNRSEAMRRRLAAAGPEGRAALTAAAHATVRGVPKSWDDLCKKATGRAQAQSNLSPLDRALATMLQARQIPCQLGTAIGPYNADLTTGPIAVEIFGGGWHGGGRAAARWPRRIRYLLDQGWHVVVIWVEQRRDPLTIKAADYIVTLVEQARRDPATVCQYRVIRGAGQEIIRGCAQDDHFPVKPPRKRRLHIRCDHQAATD
jgi:transcriptional regulator with XRE-family HTH domain